MSLAGRRIVVTGGASGIGAATAVRLAKEGATLIIADRDEGKLAAVIERAKQAAGAANAASHVAVALDVSDEKAVAAFFEANGQDLDACVHCAGINPAGPPGFDSTPMDFVRRILDINLLGTFHVDQGFIKAALKRGSAPTGGFSLVNVASAHGLIGCAGAAPYSASKHAVIGLTRSLAKEYASRNIRVNAVCPGPIATPLLNGLLDAGLTEDIILPQIPAGRLGSAEEVANYINFLVGPDSSYATGGSNVVDGGWIAQ